MCGVMSPSFVPGEADRTAFNEGQRQLGLDILNLLDMRGYEALREMERHGLDISEIYADPFQKENDR